MRVHPNLQIPSANPATILGNSCFWFTIFGQSDTLPRFSLCAWPPLVTPVVHTSKASHPPIVSDATGLAWALRKAAGSSAEGRQSSVEAFRVSGSGLVFVG